MATFCCLPLRYTLTSCFISENADVLTYELVFGSFDNTKITFKSAVGVGNDADHYVSGLHELPYCP